MSFITRTTQTLPQAEVTSTDLSRSQRWLLAGALAGPVFLVGSFAQVPLNPGFDLTRHAFSFLSNGPHGWIQQTVFGVTGLLNIAAGIGLRRALTGRARFVAAVSAILVGAGQIVAGIWPPPPSFGYPVGAPPGQPEQMSLTAVLHGAGFATSVLSWVILLITLAVWLRHTGARRWAAATAAVAVAVLLVPPLLATPFGTVILYAVMTVAFLFTSAVYTRLARPRP